VSVKLTRLLDFVIYVAIGVAVVLAVLWGAEHYGPDTQPLAKWGGLTATALVLFGYAIREYWACRRQKSFWLTLCALVFAHVLGFSIVLVNVHQWKVLWFVFAFPLENLAIDAALAFTGHRRAPRGWRRRTNP
jgi:chromate transport protein ChrA